MVLDTLEKRDAKAADFRNLETVPIASELSVFSIHNGDAGMYYSKESFVPLLSPLKTPSGMPGLDEAKDEVLEMQVEDREPLRMRLSDQFMAQGDRPASSSSNHRSSISSNARPRTPLGTGVVNLLGSVIGSVETAAAMASPGGTGHFHQEMTSSWQQNRIARQGAAGRPMTADCVPSMSHQTRLRANVLSGDMLPEEPSWGRTEAGSSNDSLPPTRRGNPSMRHLASADGARGAAVMAGNNSTGDPALRTGRFGNAADDASRWGNPDHGRTWMPPEASGVATMTQQLGSLSGRPEDGPGSDVSPHLIGWGWGS